MVEENIFKKYTAACYGSCYLFLMMCIRAAMFNTFVCLTFLSNKFKIKNKMLRDVPPKYPIFDLCYIPAIRPLRNIWK